MPHPELSELAISLTSQYSRIEPIEIEYVQTDQISERAAQLEREGCDLIVTGADMVDGTPIYDIKPYLPYADAHPDARGGFAEAVFGEKLAVDFPPELLARLPEGKRAAALKLLAEDPRPAVRTKDADRIFGLRFAGFEIKFRVADDRLTVVLVEAY
jgi:hypothetical protein